MLHLRAPLVLASQSPRRRDLLAALGLPFCVQPSGADEVWPDGEAPGPAVETLARQKAEAVAEGRPEALTLGADTVVVLHEGPPDASPDAEVLGKPRTEDEARSMLARLGGRSHHVYSGIALVHPPSRRVVTAHERTEVTFAPLTDAEIAAYVATGSPMDKAGAYGIQDDAGALFVSGVAGDYYNVVGLPLHRLYRTLRDHFSDLLA
jgi:septum formation protein